MLSACSQHFKDWLYEKKKSFIFFIFRLAQRLRTRTTKRNRRGSRASDYSMGKLYRSEPGPASMPCLFPCIRIIIIKWYGLEIVLSYYENSFTDKTAYYIKTTPDPSLLLDRWLRHEVKPFSCLKFCSYCYEILLHVGGLVPQITKCRNCRVKLVDWVFPVWSLIHRSSWSVLVKVGSGFSYSVCFKFFTHWIGFNVKIYLHWLSIRNPEMRHAE